MKIALIGNPNSGKTTMFNALTGRREKTGNWAGVTVDKREYTIKSKYLKEASRGKEALIAVDLPGAYSMSPYTQEESVTSGYIMKESPDVIVNIVDSTNLGRNLFLTTQLLEMGIPVVIALNKSDLNEKRETEINERLLEQLLGCSVIKTVSTDEDGLKEVVEAAIDACGRTQKAPYHGGKTDLSDKVAVEQEDRKRFDFVNDIVSKVEKKAVRAKEMRLSDKIDDVITHPAVGIPVFAAVMFMVFYISQSTLGTWLSNILVGFIENIQCYAGEYLAGANPVIYALLIDGIIGGVGAVVGFLPLVMVMYFLIALLEDCGYMSRATVVLDPIFKKVGLSGKSVIPMIIGTGCGIPAIMACRTIRDERERRATAMLATFMPCGAKLPVIALFAGAFFPGSKWIGPLMYFMGIALILMGALIIKAASGMKYRRSFFIIELPEYKLPGLKEALMSMLSRGKAYIVKAGTVILVCNTAVQIMQSFDMSLQPVVEGMEDTSLLAAAATPFAVLLVPVVGVAAWQLAAAAITGFIAKENVVGTLATVYAITNFIDVEELELVGGAGQVASTIGITQAAALAFLMFNLFTPPCFAALGAMNSEMQSRKWLLAGIGMQLGTGFTVGYFVYQIGTLASTGSFGAGFGAGFTAVTVFAVIITGIIIRGKRSAMLDYRLEGVK